MTGFRKGEGTESKGISKEWQESKLWNCVKCRGSKKIGGEICLYCKIEKEK